MSCNISAQTRLDRVLLNRTHKVNRLQNNQSLEVGVASGNVGEACRMIHEIVVLGRASGVFDEAKISIFESIPALP
jgi:hypothetical protein